MTNIFAACLVCMLVPALAYGEDKPGNPLDDFGESSWGLLKVCSVKGRIAFRHIDQGKLPAGEAISSIANCQKQSVEKVRKLFPKAKRFLGKNRSAQKALEDYYTAWTSAINGAMLVTNESRMDYEKRQGEASRYADTMWDKVEIEVEKEVEKEAEP